MKKLEKPRIFLKRTIENHAELQLVHYLSGCKSTPHLEFKINNIHCRNKRIMSKALPIYLKKCRFWGHGTIIATTVHNHKTAQKLLLQNGFVKLFEMKHLVVFGCGKFDSIEIKKQLELILKSKYEN